MKKKDPMIQVVTDHKWMWDILNPIFKGIWGVFRSILGSAFIPKDKK